MRARLVPEPAARSEKPGRRDDAEEAPDVHDAERAPGVLRPEHAARADELRRQEVPHVVTERQREHGPAGCDAPVHRAGRPRDRKHRDWVRSVRPLGARVSKKGEPRCEGWARMGNDPWHVSRVA